MGWPPVATIRSARAISACDIGIVRHAVPLDVTFCLTLAEFFDLDFGAPEVLVDLLLAAGGFLADHHLFFHTRPLVDDRLFSHLHDFDGLVAQSLHFGFG